MSDPREAWPDLVNWAHIHPIHALLWLFGLYIVLTLLLLPVWSLQVFCGYVMTRIWGVHWGLAGAIALCQLAATLAAIITFYFSEWLAAEWLQKKVEAKMHKLRQLDQTLGHNGFLVVMAVRLIHVMPFALSNYAFGMTTITAIDVIVGTLLGGIPGTALYVALGAHEHLLRDWRFTGLMVLLNVILIVPIALRYLRPQWFKKIGVE